MKQSHFYAMMARMKYINRWGLMNNTKYENISEHSQQVAVLAHCLILIHNKRFGGKLDPERAALLAVFHDATEIITGDMPTPIKYANPEIRDVYRQVERSAALFSTCLYTSRISGLAYLTGVGISPVIISVES